MYKIQPEYYMPMVGSIIVCGGEYVKVNAVEYHGPGEHDRSPINNALFVTEYITDNGSRWATINYTPPVYVWED